ncbi:hypothetical protein M094_4123 [Bacteroides uniformis str. 3978 T3 ii]|uniref:Uncharacterized protein n=1 Tax=Bacteroides uniformis str. 3978 T3 ii TaxID=1339349 RepID=A0A078S8W9_BACUN|nr:hypothetical protein M094_4123 [Bacteroides uniformis str. 3978 T3 ii]
MDFYTKVKYCFYFSIMNEAFDVFVVQSTLKTILNFVF